MINKNSIKAVNYAKVMGDKTMPLYGSYCFSGIPDTVVRLFGGSSESPLPQDTLPLAKQKNYDNVFVLFIDAFGWEFFDRYKNKYSFLSRFMDQGVVNKLTSQFPSTTAVHATTMHTGLKAWEHGLPEYRYYDPIADQVIEPFNFAVAGESNGNLTTLNIDPKLIYPNQTLYKRLADLGVDSYVLANADFIDSPYNVQVSTGAQNIAYKTTTEGLVKLSKAVKSASAQKNYYYLYFEQIDKMCHTHGTRSLEVEAELDSLMYVLEKYFYGLTFKDLPNSMLLTIADHGQVNLNREKAVYINQRIPEIEKYLLKNKSGQTMVPAGSPRFMFIYPVAGQQSTVLKLLRDNLADVADVYTLEELTEQGIIRDVDKNKFYTDRLSAIYVHPHDDAAVWWYEEGKFEIKKKGNHGGLAPAEMEIPFLALSST